MLEKEKKDRAAMFWKISKTFPTKPLDAESISQYVMLTSDIDISLLRTALVKIALEARFFPTIAEIRGAATDIYADATGIIIPTPEEAWGEVMHNIKHYGMYDSHPWSYSSPIIKEAVNYFGGRSAFCALTEDNISAARAHFMRIYDACLKRRHDKIQNATVYSLIGTNKTELQALLTRSAASHDINNMLTIKEMAK